MTGETRRDPLKDHLRGPQMSNLCGTVYDNLFVILPIAGKPHFVHARYGAATPDSECK